MAINTTIIVPPRVWTKVTATAVTAVRLQNRGPHDVLLQGTVGSTPPVSTDGALALAPREVILPDLTLADLWPGVSGVDTVWIRSSTSAEISISHA